MDPKRAKLDQNSDSGEPEPNLNLHSRFDSEIHYGNSVDSNDLFSIAMEIQTQLHSTNGSTTITLKVMFFIKITAKTHHLFMEIIAL